MLPLAFAAKGQWLKINAIFLASLLIFAFLLGPMLSL